MAPMKRDVDQHGRETVGTLSLLQLAQRWHTSRKHVRRLLRHGRLNFVQIRGHLRVAENEVRRYEKSNA